jgi:hypothetical protein
VGRSKAAGIAFDNLKESVGGFISKLMDESGVVEGFTNIMRGLKNGIEELSSTAMAAKGAGVAYYKDFGAPLKQRGDVASLPEIDLTTPDMRKGAAEYEKKQKDASDARTKAFQKTMADAMENGKASIDAAQKIDDEKAKNAEEMDRYFAMLDEKANHYSVELQKQYDSDLEKEQERAYRKAEKDAHEHSERLREQKQSFMNAGLEIGQAFAGAIASAIDELSSGGDLDVGATIAGLIPTIFGVLGGLVGSIIPGLGTAAGASLGSSFGSIAGAGIRAATRRQHSGGPIERYHTGGFPGLGPNEVPIIAEVGEHMWSKQQVQRAGGPARVAAMANGGGGGMVQLNVSTIDARGVREFFVDQGGRGFQATIKTGRGDIARMFKGFK